MKKKDHKILTIRLPINIWKSLKMAILEGKIKSIQAAIVELLRKNFS